MDGMTIVEFLRARLHEDKAVARAATAGPWYWEQPTKDAWPQMEESLRSSGVKEGKYDAHVLIGWGYDACGIEGSPEDRSHIARHDPARVLREVEAKRQIIAEAAYYLDTCGDDDVQVHATHTLESLAAVYSDHPDYRDEWR